MGGDPMCGYCAMPLSQHCCGNVEHLYEHKNRTSRVTCHTRHCLAPLCDCVDFVEAKPGAEVAKLPPPPAAAPAAPSPYVSRPAAQEKAHAPTQADQRRPKATKKASHGVADLQEQLPFYTEKAG